MILSKLIQNYLTEMTIFGVISFAGGPEAQKNLDN